MESSHQPRWEGKATAKLKGPSADQVWALLGDFSNVHKWLPGLNTCRIIEGVSGQPGCVRYCAGESIPSDDGEAVSWVKEKLLAVDPIGRCLTYEVIDSNSGFGWYVGTVKVSTESDGGDGCTTEWSFVSDPVAGLTQEGLISYLGDSLKVMTERMEAALQAGK